YLKEDHGFKVYSTTKEQGGKRAVTHFHKIKTNGNYTLLDIALETGRKNQIRVHMFDLGHPVVGDKKYGVSKNPLKRLGLHAKTLAFNHPETNKLIEINSPVPQRMANIV